MEHVDVVVVGGGVMGAAATWSLASRGRRVVLLERFEPGHMRGSSHSTARIFRLGYEELDYIRLARAAQPRWRALEAATGTALLDLVGTLDHGPAEVIDPLVAAMRAGGVEVDLLDPAEAAARFPGVRFDDVVAHHADGGRVLAQASVDALHDAARAAGADVRFQTAVAAVEPDGTGVTVRLGADDDLATDVIRADVVVVTAGAWAAKVLGGLVDLPPLQVSAENPFHFAPRPGTGPYIPLVHRGFHDKYSLASPGEGVKVAEHYRDEWLDPDDRPFDDDPASLARVQAYVRDWMPGLDPEPILSVRCLYTTTPSKDPVIDRVGRVVVGAGFSGHGFKFAPAIGDLLADLADGASQQVDRWRLDRDRDAVHAGVK